ncbi:hypothetical protein L1887_42780 [Cichorium endivia]|nr:hypothetical protein L1887_42780 [Cichorium endivia]
MCTTSRSRAWRPFLAATCRRTVTTSIFRCTFSIPGRLSSSSTITATRCRRRCSSSRRRPHAFITESDSDGHVLTVREDLIWPLLEVLYPGTREAFGLPGICLSLSDRPDELAALKHYWQLIARESTEQLPGREHTLVLLAQAVFTLLLRNAKLDDHASGGMRGELKLFQRFTQMIDTHYHQHWTVPEYASELHLTESRLTDICRRFANRPPKRLIFDRQLREGQTLAALLRQRVGCSPSAYRAQKVPVSPVPPSPRPSPKGRGSNRTLSLWERVRVRGNHTLRSLAKSTRRCPNRPFTLRPSQASIKQQKQNINLTTLFRYEVPMKPEEFRADAKRPLTGEEYLKSLQDGREIYIYGERVKDVTTHPAFRNAAASIAQMYDALHKPDMQDALCWGTDTGSGGYTHKFFRMGRTPDYKAAFGCALGANPAFYGQFEQNARNWYTHIQETGLYFNHAIVNPPIDRHKPADEVKDVYIKLEKETDAGIIVSGAKVVATNSALTHYNMIGFGSAQVMGENPDFALMFVAPMDAEGVKLISRASYEMVAGATGSPYDYPLSSRFDENDAILVMDHVLIPWENVLIYRDFDRCRRWTMEGGFARMYPLQACVRLAVKLDFITALLKKSLECTGTLEFRGVQADLGEVVAWRNMFWALSDSMCSEATPWVNGAYLPDHAALQTYRVMAPMAYAKIKNIIERNVTSGLIYLPSSARDLNNPQIDQYLAKYVRGSNGMDHVERIKILKLMWDAIGSEFGGRHELYEINYSGSQDEIRLQCLRQAQSSGNMDKMMAMVDRCMSEYDQHGWTVPHLHNNSDINMLDKLLK